MCGGVEKAKAVEVVEVVEAVHQTLNRHSTSARSNCTWWSSTVPWIASAVSTTLYPSHAAHTALCTSCRPSRAASTLIHSGNGPDH